MIVEPTMLVVRDQQGHLFPLRARSQGLVHLLHELLPSRHVMRRVVVVRREQAHVEVTLLDHNVVGKLAQPCVALEFQRVVVELEHVLQLPQALEEQGRRDILVIYPKGEPTLLQGVEDGLLWEPMDEVLPDVAHGAMRGRRVDVEPVRLSRRRHRREPPVEHAELVRQRSVGW